MAHVAVIGGGAFGTAMACVMQRAGHAAALWARESEVVAAIRESGENTAFLPGVRLASGIRASGDLGDVLTAAEIVLLAVPAQFLRAVAERMRPHIRAGTPVVSCAKGIERDSCALMPDVMAETIPQATVAVLSGPSFAKEIAVDLPTGVSIACGDARVGGNLVRMMGTSRFRTYLTDDVTGVALGGALKNVFAIASGIAAGKRLGDGARATLITRGLAEMTRLGISMGARMETFLGLSGVGDLALTCNALQSRNTSFGVAVGEGRDWRQLLRERKTVTEGQASVPAVLGLGRKYGIDLAIVRALDEILSRDAEVDLAISHLLAHPLGAEWAALSENE